MVKLLKFKFRVTSFIICLQLTLSPLAFAEPIPVEQGGGLSGFANNAQTFASFINQAASAYTNASGNSGQQRYQQFKQQLSPFIKLKPEQPGRFPAAFNGCVVLEAKGNRLSSSAQCGGSGVSQDDLLSGYAQAIIDIADENAKKLDNFGVASADRTETRGQTCYNEAIANIAGQLEQREAQLDAYTQRLQTLVDNFDSQSKATVEAIKQNDAILNGPCRSEECQNRNGSANKDYLEDFKFDNLLLGGEDRAICGSWFTRTAVAAQGQSEGLRGIEETVREKLNEAEKFNDQRKQITGEINSLATLLANGFKKRDGFEARASSISTRTNYINPSSGALKASIDRFNNRLTEEITTISDGLNLNSVIGQGNQQAALLQRQIQANSIDHNKVEEELVDLERSYYKSCVERVITSNDNWGSVSSLARSFRNPNVRKKLSDEADNSLANSIVAYVDNLDELDIDQFIQKIKTLEGQGLNRSKIILLDKSLPEVGISASTPLPPSRLFSIIANNCKKRFNSEDTSSGFPQAEVIKSLRNYSNKLSNLKKRSATTLLADVKKDLLTCPGTSAGTSTASCTDADLSTSSPNFCVKAATKCSSNVFACNQKVQSKINEVKTQQDQLVGNYNKEVTDLKNQLVNEVSSLQSFMVTESNRLNALLNVGTLTKLPELALTFNDKDFSRSDVRANLALEDPAKYLELATEQVANLKAEMIKQREELVGANGADPSIGLNGKGRLGNFASQYVKRYQDEIAYYNQIKSECEGALKGALDNKQRQNDAIAEQNKQIAEACDSIQAFNVSPLDGDPAQVANDAAAAVRIVASLPNPGRPVNLGRDQQTIDRIRQFNQECAEPDASYGSPNVSVNKICRTLTDGTDADKDTIEQRIEEFFSGNSDVASLCNDLIDPTGASNEQGGLRECGQLESFLTPDAEGNKVCKVKDHDGTIYKYTDGSWSSQEQVTVILVSGNCSDLEYYKDESLDEESNAPNGDRVSFSHITPADIEGSQFNKIAQANPEAIKCIPEVARDRSERRQDRETRQAIEDELNIAAAGFNCEQSRRAAGVGRAGLTICGAGYNGQVSEKNGLVRDLAGAVGEAAGAAFGN